MTAVHSDMSTQGLKEGRLRWSQSNDEDIEQDRCGRVYKEKK